MHRQLLAAVLAGVVLAPASNAAPAPAPPANLLTATRQYGDGPVVVPKHVDRVRVAFHGHAGDRVHLRGVGGCPVTLRSGNGTTVPQEPSRFWRLPKRGTYTFGYHRCGRVSRPVLQFVKLVVHRLAVDGPPLRLNERLGYVTAAAIRVPASGRVQVTLVAPPPGGTGSVTLSLTPYTPPTSRRGRR